MSNAPKDKIINTTGYISNLLDESEINKIDENGEPKIEYVEKLYNEYNDGNFSDSITFSTLGYESNLQKMKQAMQDEGDAIDSAVQQSGVRRRQHQRNHPGIPAVAQRRDRLPGSAAERVALVFAKRRIRQEAFGLHHAQGGRSADDGI